MFDKYNNSLTYEVLSHKETEIYCYLKQSSDQNIHEDETLFSIKTLL